MKKLLFLLLITVVSYGQTYQNPTFGTVTTKTSPTVTNDPYVTTTGATGIQGKIAPVNVIIPHTPVNYTVPNLTIGAHLSGIDTRLGQISSTTAGLTQRIYFTADNTTVNSIVYFASNAASKGVTAAGSPPALVLADNTKGYFTKDLISIPQPAATIGYAGSYSGNLTVSATPTPVATQQRFTVEVYRTNNLGTPIASGVSGAPVGDLGVAVVAILDSGIINLTAGSITNVSITGILTQNITINTGERLRYHVSAAKIGAGGGNVTFGVYYGSSYNSYYDVPVAITTDAVLNKSNVAGVTDTDALNNLYKQNTYVTPEQYGAVSDGITDDKTAIQNAINSGKMVLLNGNYFTSGTITVSNKTTIYGNGKIITTANLPIFDIKSNDIVIDGIRFEGNGRGTVTNYATTRPLQIGINIFGANDLSIRYSNIRVSNCYFNNIGGSAIKVDKNHSGSYEGSILVTNTIVYNSFKAYELGDRAEYSQFSNVKATNCEYGAYILGGNNPFSNPSFEFNRTGVFLGTGVNPSHSVFSGGSINHSIDKTIDSNANQAGQLFCGVMMIGGNINILNSDNTKFLGCEIYATNIDVTTSANTTFAGCKFTITPTFTGINSIVFSNTKWILTPPTNFVDTNEQNFNVGVNNSTRAADKIRAGVTVGGVNILAKTSDVSGVNRSAFFVSETGTNSAQFGLAENFSAQPFTSLNAVYITSRTSGIPIVFTTNNGGTESKKMYIHSTGGVSIGNATDPGASNMSVTGDITAALYTGSAALTSTSTAVTASVGDNDTSIATTAFVSNTVSGTSYTPTLTASLNCSSPVLGTAVYSKTGNIVTVTVGLTATVTAANTGTTVNITLPVTRVSTDSEHAGVASGKTAGTFDYYPGVCQFFGNTTEIKMIFKPLASGGNNFIGTFSYKIN